MLDLIFAAALVICVLRGVKKGFVKTAMGAVSILLSIFIGIYFYRPFTNLMFSVPFIAEMLTTTKDSVANTVKPLVEQNLPEYIRAIVPAGAIEGGSDAVAVAVAETVFKITLAVIFIVVIKIGISLLAKVLDIAAKLPVLKQMNGLLGGAAGLVGGIIVCCLMAVLLYIASAYGAGEWITKQLSTSIFAKYFFDNNVIIKFILN